MAKTGAQLRARINANLGNRSDKDTEILAAVNTAIGRLAAVHNWRGMAATSDLSLSSGTNNVSASSDLKCAVSEYLTFTSNRDDKLLTRTTSFRHDRVTKPASNFVSGGITSHTYDGDTRYIGSSSNGEPRICYLFGNTYYVYPTPDQDYTMRVRYYIIPSEIEEDDEHILGVHVEEAIIALATAEMMAQLTLWDDASGWEQKAAMRIGEAKTNETQAPSWTPTPTLDGVANIPVG